MHNNKNVIEKIRFISNQSDSLHIREKIIHRNEVECLENLFSPSIHQHKEIIDIPIKNIISINKLDRYWESGDTWLDVLNKRLLGKGWGEDVITYFENEIDKVEFPPIDSRGYLELTSYNGLIVCRNGNHRLPAAVCWLASKNGDNKAILKKVDTLIIKFNEKKLKVLKKLYQSHNNGIRIITDNRKNSDYPEPYTVNNPSKYKFYF